MWKSNAASIPRSEKIIERAFCTIAEQVGDCVINSGPKIGTIYTVSKMIPTVDGMSQAVGIITKKYDSTTCRVQLLGPLKGVVSGLVPGKRCWVGKDSKITQDMPSLDTDEILYLQVIGTASDFDEMVLNPQIPIVLRG
jgi:hypothetical protein